MNFQVQTNFLIFLEAHTQNRRRSPHFSTFSFEIHESNVSYHRSSTNIISKRKRPQDRRRGTFIRTHGHGERQQFSWNRRSGRSWRKREREGEPDGNVETKRKVEERERESISFMRKHGSLPVRAQSGRC